MQQTEILGEQDYKCRLCHTRFAKNVRPIYDHIDGDHSNNSIKNGQAICSNCHDIKSAKENQKRSIEKKNINFVKRCPLCHKKIKGKDFKDFDTGEKITTDHLPANEFIPCRQCKSEFKVVRHDPKAGKQTLTGKKLEVVQYCPHCDVEFDETVLTNKWLKCDSCEAVFGVWIKEYKKPGFWS